MDPGLGLAEGTDNWRGGVTIVGERGPEVVNLPRGSQVIPSGPSMAMLSRSSASTALGGSVGGGGGDLTLTVPLTIDGRQFAQATAHFTAAEINRQSLNQPRTFRPGMA